VLYLPELCERVRKAVRGRGFRLCRDDKEIAALGGVPKILIRWVRLRVDDNMLIVADLLGELADGNHLEGQTGAIATLRWAHLLLGAHDIAVAQYRRSERLKVGRDVDRADSFTQPSLVRTDSYYHQAALS
jgi:hypothetical protein